MLSSTPTCRWRLVGCFLVAWGLGIAQAAVGQRFLPDDPLWVDPDTMDSILPEPQSGRQSQGPIAFIGRTFGAQGEYSGPAQNVNTLGEVPESSWYTPRHYYDPMSEAELKRGPNQEVGPSMAGPWRVVQLSQQGGLPRIVVRDAADRRFTLRFDSPAHPEMATGAAMVSSRLLHALGYNVPHYWLRSIRRTRLIPRSGTGVTDAKLDSLLDHAYQRPDGTYRALVRGIPDMIRRIGPFAFHGTRPDDKNDVFPHEARRELRGLRVVAAWIEHSTIAPRHTLDVGVREDGKQFVRHYLTDLHLTLGSGGAAPTPGWAGHEHVLELDQVAKRMGTLGLTGENWDKQQPPDWEAVGQFHPAPFQPEEWRPQWPNPAFKQCDSDDAFWAAKQIRHISGAALEAIVETARYSEKAVSRYLVETLKARRDLIANAYLHWGGGLDRFAVRGDTLAFEDLRAKYELAPDTIRRTITWHVYENEDEQVGGRLARTTSPQEVVALPDQKSPFLRATLQTPRVGVTRVYLRRTSVRTGREDASSYEVVGIERAGPDGA